MLKTAQRRSSDGRSEIGKVVMVLPCRSWVCSPTSTTTIFWFSRLDFLKRLHPPPPPRCEGLHKADLRLVGYIGTTLRPSHGHACSRVSRKLNVNITGTKFSMQNIRGDCLDVYLTTLN